MKFTRIRFVAAVLAGSLVALLSGCGGEESRPAAIGNSECTGIGCTSPDGGNPDVDQPDVVGDALAEVTEPDADFDAPETSLQDVIEEPYTGPTGTLTGTAFVSSPPTFPTVRTDEYPLYFPATVAVWAHGVEYTAPIDPTAGFVLSGVPVGPRTIVVRDIDQQNGLLDSALAVDVPEGESTVDLPAIGKNAFVVIYGVLEPPVIRDPSMAQVVLSFEACAANGGERLTGVTVTPPMGSQTVVVRSGASWTAGTLSGTGDNGVAIIANVPAEPFPGSAVEASYTFEDQNYPIPSFTVFQGGVIRVVVVHPC